ncbi:MAG: hypothetical protein KFB93_08915 [Simkaniaceae bacterium]|nr:MAG: hypothetical protein KFB93_08915 [Simkaniaceae bacterium]
MATLESLLFGSIPQGIRNPAGNDYSIIGKYFHDMHAQAHYTVGGDGRANDNFHPIAACTKAVIMGIACSIITNQICKVVPGSLRNHFRIGLEGGPWIYAASIIYQAAQGWTAASEGKATSSGSACVD